MYETLKGWSYVYESLGGKVIFIFPFQILNIDLSHVENKVTEMIKHDRSLFQLQGDLISKYVSIVVFNSYHFS